MLPLPPETLLLLESLVWDWFSAPGTGHSEEEHLLGRE